MIERIDLRHFKCFELLKLPVRPLTLLSGLNASGKSSVIQAFALLHQTVREHEWSPRLVLNGNTVRLGTAGDVIDQVSGRLSFGIGLIDNDTEYQWNFRGDRDEMSLLVTDVVIGEDKFPSADGMLSLHRLLPRDSASNDWIHLQDRLGALSYLTAERIGPKDIYPLEDPQYGTAVGPQGECAVSVLYSFADRSVADGLARDDAPPTRRHQVASQMARFFPGCELDVSPVPKANSVSLGVRISAQTDFHRPGHTGFGITQVLPIIVACLNARRDHLVLIENPEVHLHPAGQTTMGMFLGEVAAAGVQVILETHSDHVLSGVRRTVKKGLLRPEDVALHFFRSRQEADRDGGAQVLSPQMTGDGDVDNWPDGFFDQFDKDMSHFLGWS